MHIQSLTFDRVFSISQRHTKWGKWTEFGFESGAMKVLEASVYGHPTISPGANLLLALPKPDDWKNICGWAYLDTGEVAVDGGMMSDFIALLVLWLAFILAMLPMFFLRIPELSSGQVMAMSVGVIGITLLMGYSARRVWRTLVARRILIEHIAGHNSV